MERRIEYMPLDELVPAARNPKGHDLGQIEASIGRQGYVEPVVLDERTGRLVAGHGRVATLKRVRDGGGALPDGVGDGWLVPVVRGWGSKSDADAEAYLVGSNQLTMLGGWDDGLAALLADLANNDGGLVGTGFTADDLAALLALDGNGEDGSGDGDDDVEIVPEGEPTAKVGDLWQIGPHRLVVGDCFDPDTLRRLLSKATVDLVLTDPPYAIYGSSTGISSDIADDKMVRPFFEQLGRLIRAQLKPFGHAYLFCDWRSYATVWHGCKTAKLAPKNCILWDKGNFGMGAMYGNAHEFVFFAANLPSQKAMTSGEQRGQRSINKPNIFRTNRPTGDDRQHNAAKPVDLLEWLIGNSTDPGETVLDPFSGSGSTLVAAHRTDRIGYASELEPRFADITINRLAAVTGATPVLVEDKA